MGLFLYLLLPVLFSRRMLRQSLKSILLNSLEYPIYFFTYDNGTYLVLYVYRMQEFHSVVDILSKYMPDFLISPVSDYIYVRVFILFLSVQYTSESVLKGYG